MSFTYTPETTDTGKIRLLINDKYEADPIFQDEEIAVFLLLEQNNVKRGAAAALETIARDEALVSKVVKTLQLSTDGAKLSAELRQHAQALRAQAADDLAGTDAAFEIAEWAIPPFGTRDRLYNEALRDAGGAIV